MRFSTTHSSVAILYPPSTSNVATPMTTPSTSTAMYNFKKAVASFVSKLPQQPQTTGKYRKVSPVVKNNNRTYIKVVAKKQQQSRASSSPPSPPLPLSSSPPASTSSAMSREQEIYRDLRKYYTNSNNSTRKRQLIEDDHHRNRQEHHQTVKQYQNHLPQQHQQPRKTTQPTLAKKVTIANHWKEETSSAATAKGSCATPPQFKTHSYIRDIRSNPNHLRLLAVTNSYCSQTGTALNHGKQHIIRERHDQFVWGSSSSLRNSLTVTAC